ncbi:hypothetical protein R3P38DRAFT_2543191 [Favolaschia claudopus]|uniref:Uncharacterized protein n=1 Tax=Favolaschia claudopus TaxID=2862362 RepID=A0AAW0ASL4_9AGAR
MGLYELRRRLGVPQEAGIFQRFRQQFNNADVAWFSGGLSIDGKHIPVRPGFFTDFDDLRKALPSGVAGYEARKDLNAKLQLALFDMATLWDRSFGGTTMVIHIDGTTVPNTPALPEYLRASVYLPPRFLSLHPASHGPIAKIVQSFIESVGVPTIQQWRQDALTRNWPMTQTGTGSSRNPASPVIIPTPAPNSAHYKFLGRPPGVLDTLLAAPAPAPGSATAPAASAASTSTSNSAGVPVVEIPDDDEDWQVDEAVLDAIERAGYAEAELHSLQQQVDILTAQVQSLESANSVLRAASASAAPTTPSRSQVRSPRTPVASTSRALAPPAYSPSPRSLASTGRNLFGSPSRAPPSPSHTGLNSVEACLQERNLNQDQCAAILLIVQNFHPVQWVEKFCELGIERGEATELANILAASM